MIGIVVTNYGRTSILRIFCEGIKRLRQETGLIIPVICVGSKDGIPLCDEYHIRHIEHPNKPLTGKFNRACLEMKKYNPSHVMVMGSDNLLSTETFLRINKEAEKGIDLIGLNDVYFFGMDDVHVGKLIYFGYTSVLGVGRTVSAKVLNKVGWQPWGIERDRAIDTVMLDTVRDHVETRSLLEGGFVFDLKTSMNLNPIHFWAKKKGYMPNEDVLWNNIGDEETRLIKEYISSREK